MRGGPATSYQRVMTALGGGKPDRVPVILPLTVHGAKELGLPIAEYFAKAEHVAEGQLRLQRKFGHDALFLEFYSAAEAMAFGAEPIFFEDGPPNMGVPPIRNWEDIRSLSVPDPLDTPPLRETRRAIELVAARVKGSIPIIAVAIPPFSLPAMLLGIERWLELLLFGPEDLRAALLRVSGEFCVRWANAQLAAGADAIVLPDAISSTSIITREQFAAWSLPLLRETIQRISGPAVVAGVGRVLEIADLLGRSGAAAALVTAEDDLLRCRQAFDGRLALAGNLNNIAMIDWTYDAAFGEACGCLDVAAAGGGYLLAPQWEVPFAVPDEPLVALVDAAERWIGGGEH